MNPNFPLDRPLAMRLLANILGTGFVRPTAILAALLIFAPLTAFAHAGEDHDAPAPVVSESIAPRASASSEDFEAVAVLNGKQLLIYLDHFASNAPVLGAKVEIEGVGLKGTAAETSPGVYVVDAASITPAKHSLTISIETSESADLLPLTLEVPPSPMVGVHTIREGKWIIWLSVGALALVGGTLWVIRRSKQTTGVK